MVLFYVKLGNVPVLHADGYDTVTQGKGKCMLEE